MSFTDIGSSLSPVTTDFGTFASTRIGQSTSGAFNNAPVSSSFRIDSSTPERLYRIGFGAAASFNVGLNYLTDNADLSVIYDANGNGYFDAGEEIARSTNAGIASESISLTNLKPGDYYVYVHGATPNVQTFFSLPGFYTVDYPVSTTTSDDTLATARSLTPGTAPIQDAVSNTDPNDFYKFTLDQSGIFTASLTGLTGDADVRLIQDKNNNGTIDPAQLYNPTTGQLDPGEILAWQWERGTGSETIRRFLNPGTYYIQVNSYNNQAANYTLGTTFTQAASDPQRFTITATYDNNLNATARATIQKAIDYWQNIILSVDPNAGNVLLPQNLAIPFRLDTQGRGPVDGANGQLSWNNQNGITRWTSGDVVIGSQYLNQMNSQPNLDPSIMIHEIGHVLGLINSRPVGSPLTGNTYPGNSYAGWVYGELLGTYRQTNIPLQSGHWSQQVFGYETMTPRSSAANSFSQLSIAALRDVGWTNITNINFGAAQSYVLPTPGLATGTPIVNDRGNLTFNSTAPGSNYTPNGTLSDTNFNQIWSVTLRPTDDRLKVDLTSGNANLRVINDRNKNRVFDAGEEVTRLTDSSVPVSSNVFPVDGNGSYYIVAYQPTPGQTNQFGLRVESYKFIIPGLAINDPITPPPQNLFTFNGPGNYWTASRTFSNTDTNPNQIWKVTLSPADSQLKLDLSGLTGNVNLRLIDDRNNNGIFDTGEEVRNLTDPGLQPKSTTAPVNSNDNYYIVVYQGTPGQTASFNLKAESLRS